MASSDHPANEVNSELINSLPNPVNTLQTEVAQLWEERKQDKLEVENLRRETTVLKLGINSTFTRSDKVFTLFLKFAKELRTLMRDTFLEIPQSIGVRLVTVENDGTKLPVPAGRHSVLRRVNKESRHEAEGFQRCCITQNTHRLRITFLFRWFRFSLRT
jgi:hypothetical protein